MVRHFVVIFVLLTLIFSSTESTSASVRLKDLARVDGDREIPLVGYGLVVGLAGTGDSSRNKATLQSLANTLSNFGLQVSQNDLNSRNVAAVMVTGALPAFGEPGDRLDVQVASTGDSKSLNGGTLLLAPLYGPDENLYALSQGAIAVGGYQVESFSNITKKNHATVGQIPRGGTVERGSTQERNNAHMINIILDEPDYTTASRVVSQIRSRLHVDSVEAIHPGKIQLLIPKSTRPMEFIARLENISVTPDVDARVVVNARTGTIVAGANVVLGEVSIAHGDLRIEVETTFMTSQPNATFRGSSGARTVVTPDTKITVSENSSEPVQLPSGTTVGELVQALNRIRISTRDTITILQSIKTAGALHAELIIK